MDKATEIVNAIIGKKADHIVVHKIPEAAHHQASNWVLSRRDVEARVRKALDQDKPPSPGGTVIEADEPARQGAVKGSKKPVGYEYRVCDEFGHIETVLGTGHKANLCELWIYNGEETTDLQRVWSYFPNYRWFVRVEVVG